MISSALVHSSFTPRHLNLILLPTERCNFRCTYCYEDFELGRMEPNVIQGVKNLISRRAAELWSLDISWFGGEPLLARDIVVDISRFARDVCGRHDIKFSSNITTNGYLLTRSLWRELLGLGVSTYQISLDGYGEVHDSSRVLANGGGTFERIWDNLHAARSLPYDFSCIVRIHFEPDRVRQIDDLTERLNAQFGGDLRFKFFFKAIERLGGRNDHLIRRFDEASAEAVQRHLQRSVDPRQVYAISGEHDAYICYASKANSFVVRSDGSLAKCTVGFDSPRNKVGALHEDGSLSIVQENFRHWIRGFSTFVEKDLACPYQKPERSDSEGRVSAVDVPLDALYRGR